MILSYRSGEPHRVRTVPLPSPTCQIAVNCDGSLLAVEVLSNGCPFLHIYSVPSFLSAQPQLLETIRVCPEENVKCRQLCWNPVIPNILAVCLHNGGLFMYALKDKGFEFHSLDKSNAVQSICWSPKGKQIVAGQLGFKLVQYKPDLAMARTIQCPTDPSWGQCCSVITIQWLSTYQFAVAMLPQAADAVPNLIIVNAPKSNQISMVNYRDDICFGEPGPRAAQMFFVHVHEWNMLLVASANSPDIDLLVTTEAGDAPTWVQYCIEPRVGTPTVLRGEQSFPIGLTTDISGVQTMDALGNLSPPRLSIHVMANFGDLLSFAVNNQLPNMKDVCSPPAPARDQSGLSQFVAPQPDDHASPARAAVPAPAQPSAVLPRPAFQPSPPAAVAVSVPTSAKESDMTFNFGAASTPIVQQKATSIFGGGAASSSTTTTGGGGGGLFGASVFGVPASTSAPAAQVPPVKPISTFAFPKPADAPPPTFSQTTAAATATNNIGAAPPTTGNPQTKPLISVPPKFAPPAMQATSAPVAIATTDGEDQEAMAEMMREDIANADAEIKQLIRKCKSINVSIGSKEEMKNIMKDLSSLTDFSQQAVESSDQLGAEVRMLNLSLHEAFSTTKTANDFFARYKSPETTRPRDYMAHNPANRRMLIRLENALINNEQQMNFIQKQLMAQWAEHEEVRRQYSKDRMHIPCLEGVYETLTRQKEILFRERQKINYITSKLGVRMLTKLEDVQGTGQSQQQDAIIESMGDSMLSMTLNETLPMSQKRVDPKKMRQLTAYLSNRPVIVVCPARPKSGMSSEVILARKEKLIKSKLSTKKSEISSTVVAQKDPSIVKTKIPVVTEIAPTIVQKPIPAPTVTPLSAKGSMFGAPAKPAAVPTATKAPSFGGGFGDSSFGSSGSKITIEAKENLTPNVMPTPVPGSGFGGFGGATATAKKEDPPKASSPFAFNLGGSVAKATVISSLDNTKASGNAPVTVTAPAKITSPAAVTVGATPISATTTSMAKPLFGGISSGPLNFGGNTGTTEKKTTPVTVLTGSGSSPAFSVPLNENAVLDNLKICSPATTLSAVDAAPINIFSSNAFSNLLDTSTSSTPVNLSTSTATSPFVSKSEESAKSPAKPEASIFGGFGGKSTANPASAAPTTTTSGSFFGSGFGGGATTGTSIFGSSAAPAVPTTTGSATKPPATTTEGIKSLFGGFSTGGTSITTPAAAVVPEPAVVVPEKPNVVTTTVLPKPDQSVFGQAQNTATISDPSPAASSASAASAFSFGNMGLGSAAPIATTASPFGAPASTVSPFGGGGAAAATAPTTAGFGVGGGSLFGSSTGSMFGSPASTAGTVAGTAASGGSIFGGGSPSTATGGSIFGGGSVFGAGGQATATTSIFGGAQATNSTGFGGGVAAPAAAPPTNNNIFGSPSNTQAGGGSIFGGGVQASSASSGFSFASASAAPAFGSPAPVASPFGGQQPSPASAFGQPQSPFGGGGSTAGQGAGGSVFGKPAGGCSASILSSLSYNIIGNVLKSPILFCSIRIANRIWVSCNLRRATGVWWRSLVRRRVRTTGRCIATDAAEQSVCQSGIIRIERGIRPNSANERDAAAKSCVRGISLFILEIIIWSYD